MLEKAEIKLLSDSRLTQRDAADESAADMRAKVTHAEEFMLQLPQVEILPVHFFAKGLYARQITIPKGVLATSAIHLFEHIDIIPQGDISVLTDDGMKRIKGPATFVSQPGLKRIGYAHEDTIWISIIACEERDLAKIDSAVSVKTYEEFAALKHMEEEKTWLSLRQP